MMAQYEGKVIADMKNETPIRELVSEATRVLEEAKAGNVGRNNLYNCRKCGHTVVTMDRDKGVTPMFIRCHRCGHKMDSMMYNVPPILVPSHEWRKGSDPEVLDLYELPVRDQPEPLTFSRPDCQPLPLDMDHSLCPGTTRNEPTPGKSGATKFHKKMRNGRK